MDSQMQQSHSVYLTDLCVSGSPEIVFLTEKTNLIHPSGELHTKHKLSLITYNLWVG